MSGYYLVTNKADPNYTQILIDCESEHKKNAPGCLLSVAPLINEEVLIKVALGTDSWLNKLVWKDSVLLKFLTSEDSTRLSYYEQKKDETGIIKQRRNYGR